MRWTLAVTAVSFFEGMFLRKGNFLVIFHIQSPSSRFSVGELDFKCGLYVEIADGRNDKYIKVSRQKLRHEDTRMAFTFEVL